MDIRITGRVDIEYRMPRIQPPTLLVSIRDQGRAQAAPRFRPDAALYLEFDDVGPKGDCPMRPEDAAAVWAFLFENVGPGKSLIIQCEMGISRSAAIGKAIECFRGFDWRKYDRSPFYPNPHVFGLMMEAAKAWAGRQEELQ